MRKHKGNKYEVHNGIVYMQAPNRSDVVFTFDEEELFGEEFAPQRHLFKEYGIE